MYKATQNAGAQPGADGSHANAGGQEANAGNAGENVTDAEFEEVK